MLIALMLTQVMVQPKDETIWRQRPYHGLGLLLVGTMWIWLAADAPRTDP